MSAISVPNRNPRNVAGSELALKLRNAAIFLSFGSGSAWAKRAASPEALCLERGAGRRKAREMRRFLNHTPASVEMPSGDPVFPNSAPEPKLASIFLFADPWWPTTKPGPQSGLTNARRCKSLRISFTPVPSLVPSQRSLHSKLFHCGTTEWQPSCGLWPYKPGVVCPNWRLAWA